MNINMNARKIQALSLKGANYLIEIYFAKTKKKQNHESQFPFNISFHSFSTENANSTKQFCLCLGIIYGMKAVNLGVLGVR